MASIIQNFLIPKNLQSSSKSVESTVQLIKIIEDLLKVSPFQKYQMTQKRNNNSHKISVSVYFESMQSLQAIAEICFDLQHSTISMEMIILRNNQYLRTRSKGRSSVFCRLLQKYNVALTQNNVCFFMDSSNGKVVIRNTVLIHTSCISSDDVKLVHELAIQNFSLVKQQVIYLIECASQTFQWQIYTKDARYLDKIHMEMAETMRNRQLISLSHICFQDSKETQNKYKKSKELINFLSFRESMVNPILKKQCFIGEQMGLFCHFLEPLYFTSSTLSLTKLQQDFTKQFDNLFYKFQARKLVNGDNPYIFNTILIKNEANVQLRDVNCEGGFSKIEIAQMEIAYTQSQNSVLELPRINSISPKKNWIDDYEFAQKQKMVYFSKIIAIKISKNDINYQKIKHEKTIVQNFRTTTSPFIIKYYNCTQKAFKYRQYLLMDYLGSNLTLSEYNQLHTTFSLHSKMHIFIHLANTLNFLEKQQVVHMDLSTHNIMVCRDLLIKVIDFGEAYHPILDSDKSIKYLPGHTLPYCPPENFNTLKKFTSKSDSFSLGMILYRILFNDFPFTPTGQLKQSFIGKSYLQKCMIAPERVGEYGYERQLLLLLQLIMRCLSPEVSLRPNPYWLYVILNKIFLSFK